MSTICGQPHLDQLDLGVGPVPWACGWLQVPRLSLAGQSGRTPQPGILLSADSDSAMAKRLPRLPHTINTIVISANVAKAFDQSSATKTAGTHATCFGLAVTTRGNEATFAIVLQRRANGLDCETIPILIDELDHFLTFWVEFGSFQ